MRTLLTNALGVVGGVAVAVGVALVFVPAGVIVAGVGALALAWRLQS